MTMYDREQKVIHWELCKRLQFDHMIKWHKPELVLEIETHKILRDYEIQTDHLIPARRPDLVLIWKKIAFYWILLFQRITVWK